MICATIAVWLRILSTAQWLYDETGSAALVGAIGVVQLLVQIPALLWGGALADRIDRKLLMMLANGMTFIGMLGLGLLASAELLTPIGVYFGIALTAASQTLANPARSAMVPMVVPKREVMLAVSTDTASANAAAIAGPLLFAGIAVAFGVTEAFYAAAGIAALSVVLPLFIRSEGVAEGIDAEAPANAVQRTWEGLRYVSRHPILPGLFLLDVGITTASFYREILPVLALGLFAGGASATGLLGAANSAGAIAGSFVAMLFVAYKAKGMLVLYASLAYALILFGFGTASSLWMGMLMIGLLGAADAVTVAVRQTTVILTTPDHMRGRAFSLLILAAQTANNVGTIWVGFWAGAIGAGNTMVLAGVISVAATLVIGFFWKPIRKFRAD